MTRDLRARYLALVALAEDQAGSPEGETAARLAAAMLERFPTLQVPEAPEARQVIATRHGPDRVLLGRVAAFLGLETFRVGRRRQDGKGTRWREGLELRGAPELLELAAELYQAHRVHLDELLDWTAIGYAQGAFPVEVLEDAEVRQVPDAAIAAALAALEAGRQRQGLHRRRLTVAED